MGLIKSNLTIHNPGEGIRGEVHDLAPDKGCDDGDLEGMPPIRRFKTSKQIDYGIIIRTFNPFNPDRVVIIIAGAYGYGTWGGIDLIRQDPFLRKCEQLDLTASGASAANIGPVMLGWRRVKALLGGRKGIGQDWAPFECIFRVRVFDDRPLVPEIMTVRPLPG
jgi:hypothetical protein